MKNKDKKSKIVVFLKENNLMPFILIGITLFTFSMLLTMQFKTVSYSTEVYEGKRESELIEDLISLKKEYEKLNEQYEKSQKIVDEYELSSTDKSELIASMHKQIEDLSVISGSTTVKGEGIIITLEDGITTVDGSVRKDTLVHDSDILTVVNELFVAGAEAVCVNDERIITTSSIRCVGSVIQINSSKVASPFVIKAIGNSKYLESAIDIKNGVADLLKNLGINVTVTKEQELTIPKYNKTISFNYIK